MFKNLEKNNDYDMRLFCILIKLISIVPMQV